MTVTLTATPTAVIALTATPAHAYCLKEISPWKGTRHSLYAHRNIPKSWRRSISAANGQWNAIPGSRLRYGRVRWKTSASGRRYQIGRLDFARAGLPDVPGITLGTEKHGKKRHSTATVLLNSRFTWNTKGKMSQGRRMTDVWTVAVHEMGHAGGLSHPWACNHGKMTRAEKNSVMNVTWRTRRHPNSDDKAGIAHLY